MFKVKYMPQMISASAAAIVKSGLETCMYATDVYDSFQNFHNTFD